MQTGDFYALFYNKSKRYKRISKARSIWDEFVEGNYKTAEPGIIFGVQCLFTIKLCWPEPIISTNPYCEVPLEDGGACNLDFFKLSRFIIDRCKIMPE